MIKIMLLKLKEILYKKSVLNKKKKISNINCMLIKSLFKIMIFLKIIKKNSWKSDSKIIVQKTIMIVYLRIGNKSQPNKQLKNFSKKLTQISKVNLINFETDIFKSSSKYF